MMSPDEFYGYVPKEDAYTRLPIVELDDLPRAYRGVPKLSYMMSTWNRRSQLARSLESLARQTWREFEVLLADDGSSQDIETVVDLFEPHLQIRYFRLERDKWHSCPSRAFHHMLPKARGEVIAIAHPEVMVHQEGLDYLYRGCTEHLDDAYYGGLAPGTEGPWYWATLKTCFIDPPHYHWLDYVNWHSDFETILDMPGFEDFMGLGDHRNSYHMAQLAYPWWFVGAALVDCPIWRDLPQFDSHGIIDMWLIDYRRLNRIIDVTPHRVMCLHQPHLNTAIAVEGEREDKTRHAKRMEAIGGA